MFETSRDLLNIVIAFCILWLSIFIAWFIYYLAMITRQAFHIVKEMRDRMHKVDEIIKSIKEKIEHSTSYLALIGEGVKKLVEVIKERTEKDKKKRRKRKQDKIK